MFFIAFILLQTIKDIRINGAFDEMTELNTYVEMSLGEQSLLPPKLQYEYVVCINLTVK